MNIEQKIYKAAIELIERRYPKGWGAAAMYTENENNRGSWLTIRLSKLSLFFINVDDAV
ncbi:hypothetical protein [Bacillus pseudomycoides]|uniref:hypothetical protein n=1 Tax=Bacillus TaxID=1386 RepID=UPI0001A192D1|nr:hypothetical protein bpmyx0001_51910 [Bacillus pseudomycoides DSM 12442]